MGVIPGVLHVSGGTGVAQPTMKQEAAGFVVLWAEYPDATLMAERMRNGTVYSSTQGYGDGA